MNIFVTREDGVRYPRIKANKLTSEAPTIAPTAAIQEARKQAVQAIEAKRDGQAAMRERREKGDSQYQQRIADEQATADMVSAELLQSQRSELAAKREAVAKVGDLSHIRRAF
jgi:hypothetical protein